MTVAPQTLATEKQPGFFEVNHTPAVAPASRKDEPCHTLFTTAGTQWLAPVQISAGTIGNLATDFRTKKQVLDLLHRLSSDDYLEYLKQYYEAGLEKFAESWDYADLLTFLHAATRLVKPRAYLEIGVRRGRSMAIVAASEPGCELYGFDMWVQNYAGMPNPGPDFVGEEMSRLGHRGKLQMVSGDSHVTVPAFLKANPDLYFDLINVDGDHSEDGARADLETVLPRLSLGGVILLDDITHPQHLYLEKVWDSLFANNPHFTSFKYRDLGYGVAMAVRKQ
jgi:predicted O-methyltransferase YrrM